MAGYTILASRVGPSDMAQLYVGFGAGRRAWITVPRAVSMDPERDAIIRAALAALPDDPPPRQPIDV